MIVCLQGDTLKLPGTVLAPLIHECLKIEASGKRFLCQVLYSCSSHQSVECYYARFIFSTRAISCCIACMSRTLLPSTSIILRANNRSTVIIVLTVLFTEEHF